MKAKTIEYECGCIEVVVRDEKRSFLKRCPIWFPCQIGKKEKGKSK